MADNEPAVWVFRRCYDGAPTESLDLAIAERTIPIAMGLRDHEKSYPFWGRIGRVDRDFGRGRWTLAHLLTCVRKGEEPTTKRELRRSCHRLLDPFNHLPFPSPKHYAMPPRGWGEDERVLSYVTWYLHSRHYSREARRDFAEFVESCGHVGLPRREPEDVQIWLYLKSKGDSNSGSYTGMNGGDVMAIDPYGALDKAQRIYAAALRSFVAKELITIYRDQWWERGVDPYLTRYQRSQAQSASGIARLDKLDVTAIGKVIVRNFDAAFAKHFRSGYKTTEAKLKWIGAIRDPEAHQADISERDIRRALEDMSDLLREAGLSEAASEIDELIQAIHVVVQREETPSPARRAPPSRPRAHEGSNTSSTFIQQDHTCLSKEEFVLLLERWLNETNEVQIGSGKYGGTPWVRIHLGHLAFHLNLDTKRAGVEAFVSNHRIGDGLWRVVESTSGKHTVVTNAANHLKIRTFNLYSDAEQPGLVV